MSINVFDFFSGCGGTSCGLREAGMRIVYAVDSNEVAAETFSKNFPEATVSSEKIEDVDVEEISGLVKGCDGPLLFSGCAPCQPFSKQNSRRDEDDPRRNLLSEFQRFVEYWQPDYVLVENVPGLQKLSKTGPFASFLEKLAISGYNYSFKVVSACDFGVPQRRERLILLASKCGSISFPLSTHGPSVGAGYSTVRDWIYDFPEISAGEVYAADPDHQAAKLSPLNMERIRATPEGGGRESWPKYLWLDCHRNYSGHTDVYSRLSWNKLASGLTTRCISFSNGRFGHPQQDRAISLREAASLQTFPKDFSFVGSLSERARQVGNAVPPLLAKVLGDRFIAHQKSRMANEATSIASSSKLVRKNFQGTLCEL